jgi:LmbE family N-acetylglucosaminyl deacetylase
MFEVLFKRDVGTAPKLLFLGAHSDDIEIGSGGTVLKLLQRFSNASVMWVVFGADGERAKEAESSADRFLEGVGEKRVVVKNFRESYFPYVGAEIKDFFEDLKLGFDPDLVVTHYRDDLHQDHRAICDFTWNTFRNHTIIEYEVPKWDGDLGRPNLYVPLSAAIVQRKIRYILDSFQSQTRKNWFTEDAFLSLLRLRGIESQEHYAEAFYSRKLVIRSDD